jgi:phytoene dehydrogenase-like protein
MAKQGRIIIVGAGIAGLCAAVYARKCGYDTVVLEQHTEAGGLATSWRREGYTFETCMHWLLGSRPGAPLNATWREVFDIDQLRFIDPPEYVRIVGADGQELPIYTDVDHLEVELLVRAPQDAARIRDFASSVRRLARLRLVDDPGHGGLASMMKYCPACRSWPGCRAAPQRNTASASSILCSRPSSAAATRRACRRWPC